ncbi:YidB family protein [Nocardia sp. CDC159]|uniref:YidB family protein n=1 Tax=Nocardia pulmonis TaxID=2951408 RepID=A0A9X2E6D3_9NOCA|nr:MULTISPECIES: YidB family protein [Nocardia]MCM6772456.1 YidB family protein [Nocardia pulmonis]MCM6784886.1 YidB family protein [Nocardia sp. CDC159]
MNHTSHRSDGVHLEIDLTKLPQASSWAADDPSAPVTPAQLAEAIDSERLAEFAAEVGIPADTITAHLSETLPEVLEHATSDPSAPRTRRIGPPTKPLDIEFTFYTDSPRGDARTGVTVGVDAAR